jgi:hypothetical protein
MPVIGLRKQDVKRLSYSDLKGKQRNSYVKLAVVRWVKTHK